MRVIYLCGKLQREMPCHLFCYVANNEYDEEKDVVKDEGSVDEHQSQPANKAVMVVSISVHDISIIFGDLKDTNKYELFNNFFCLILIACCIYVYKVFKDKELLSSQKTVEIQVTNFMLKGDSHIFASYTKSFFAQFLFLTVSTFSKSSKITSR
jgi:hypothetical protein